MMQKAKLAGEMHACMHVHAVFHDRSSHRNCKATRSGSLVSDQGFPQDRMRAGGLAIMPLCMLTVVHSKPQSTNHRFHLTTVGACAIQIL
jgi:hypothetical protein